MDKGRASHLGIRPINTRSWHLQRQPIVGLLLLCFFLVFFTACTSSTGTQYSANQLVVQQTPKSRLTYVAIGASDTFGIGTDDPQTESWPVDLAGKFGDGVRLINLGIPGVHAHDALNAEVPVALDTHPDLITIWLAVNDLADNVPIASYTHDLDQVLGRLQAADPHARIAVANVPDLTLVPHFQSYDPQTLQAQISAYNTAIATLVARHHVVLVDLYARWKDLADHPEYISDDGFHPNAIGYTRLAEIFYDVLQAKNAA